MSKYFRESQYLFSFYSISISFYHRILSMQHRNNTKSLLVFTIIIKRRFQIKQTNCNELQLLRLASKQNFGYIRDKAEVKILISHYNTIIGFSI